MSIKSISMIRFKLNDKLQNMEHISEDGSSPTSNGKKNSITTVTASDSAHNLSSNTTREGTTSRMQISATTVNNITTPATYNHLVNSNSSQSLVTTTQASKGSVTLTVHTSPVHQLMPVVTSAVAVVSASIPTVLTTATNVQYLNQPTNTHNLPLHSVIQAANPPSVIQTAGGITNHNTTSANAAIGISGGIANNNTTSTVTRISKGNILFVNKPNTTVIHTTVGGNSLQIKPEPSIHQIDTNSEDSFTDDDSPRDRRELTRRPSYNKIYSEISGPDITDNNIVVEDQTRKREIRLQKNREAARECRRKKKEYIKCLENRVAVLENQNKALIEELKSLKELYCQTKND